MLELTSNNFVTDLPEIKPNVPENYLEVTDIFKPIIQNEPGCEMWPFKPTVEEEFKGDDFSTLINLQPVISEASSYMDMQQNTDFQFMV